DVRPRLKVLTVDFLNNRGTGQIEKVVEAFKILRPAFESLATKRGFVQLIGLDHRSHRTVQEYDAFLQYPIEVRRLIHMLTHIAISGRCVNKCGRRRLNISSGAAYEEQTSGMGVAMQVKNQRILI